MSTLHAMRFASQELTQRLRTSQKLGWLLGMIETHQKVRPDRARQRCAIALARPGHIQLSPRGVTVARRIAGQGLQHSLAGAKNRLQEARDFSNEQIPRVEVRRPTQRTILCLFAPRAGHGAHPR